MAAIDEDIDYMIDYAMAFLLIPYVWGGASPFVGLDCSGYVQHVLAAIGKDPKGDQSAGSLFNLILPYTREDIIRKGTILFFGKDKTAITHVAIALNKRLMIEAGGGGSKTLTVEDAKKQNAFVRIRPIRADLVAYRNLY